MQTKNIALAIIRNNKDQILLTQRYDPDVPDAHLKWDLVGGKIEENETGEETVVRESLEEVGCEIEVLTKYVLESEKLWGTKDASLMVTICCYECRLVEQRELRRFERKIHDIKWINEKDLDRYDLIETIKPFLTDHLSS